MYDKASALFVGVALLLAMPIAFIISEFEFRLCEYAVRNKWPEWLYWLTASSWLILLSTGLIIYALAKGAKL